MNKLLYLPVPQFLHFKMDIAEPILSHGIKGFNEIIKYKMLSAWHTMSTVHVLSLLAALGWDSNALVLSGALPGTGAPWGFLACMVDSSWQAGFTGH
jgi:hypothetical protein